MQRVISIFALTVLIAACANIGPGVTQPPIRVPTLPPINVSIPPINIPSGLLPGGSGSCALISPQEVASIFGATPSFTDDSSGTCTFTLPDLKTFTVTVEPDTDIQSTRFLFGNSATDINVAGLPGLSGNLMGLPAVYVQKGTNALQILGFSGDTDIIPQLVRVATVAVGRMP